MMVEGKKKKGKTDSGLEIVMGCGVQERCT